VAPSEAMRNFVYGLQSAEQRLAAFTAFEASRPEVRHEARTYFSDGSKGYDVMGMTREQLIADVLVQFERYLALVQMPESQLVTAAPEHSVETN
jgi:choline/glycine/proline betaine transport protein